MIQEIAKLQITLMEANKYGLIMLQDLTAEDADGEMVMHSLDAYMLASIGPLVASLFRSLTSEELADTIAAVKIRHGQLTDSVLAQFEGSRG